MYFNHIDPIVPDMEEGFAWDLREMGSAWRSPGGRKDKQSVLNKGRDNMGKDKEDQPSRT